MRSMKLLSANSLLVPSSLAFAQALRKLGQRMIASPVSSLKQHMIGDMSKIFFQVPSGAAHWRR